MVEMIILFFYNYLKNNYKCSIRVIGNKFTKFICFILGIVGILTAFTNGYEYGPFFLLCGLVSLYAGIDEFLKKFQIIDDQIIYKRLFVNKRINLSDLTRIEYIKNRGYRRYRNIYNLHTVIGFKGNSKVFKVNSFTPKQLELLKGILKKYNIKMKRK